MVFDKKQYARDRLKAVQADPVAHAEWKRAHATKVFFNRILKDFGMSREGYETRLLNQQGTCAICNKPCKSGRRLAVDHNHATGAVRALLCGNCNTGLGKFQDEPTLLRKAASYVESDGVL